MATASEVLEMLIPNGGWICTGQEYEGIQFLECEPITKTQFEAGFAKYNVWKAKQEAQFIANRSAAEEKLAALGLTAEDLKALGI